jgi:hypothetical protein
LAGSSGQRYVARNTFASEYATYGLITAPEVLPLAWAMAWMSSWIFVPGILLILVLLPLSFPNGRLVFPTGIGSSDVRSP